ncbi:hypothetical protein EXIGLDRAFT_717504 [Exidia glandulosa HHB12029]|uniref:F-box domain-containing protein n=1 Tax=Exidia glandulosa HHB12029 TaxID=1314781 RepID=A0A166ALK5_EXIGL|nr:hypothetical protein EXIGLDRAFT_717504 [Exidia glandulosa HHB12029]
MSSFNAGSADAHADANSPRALNAEAKRIGPWSASQEARVRAGAPQTVAREKRNLIIRLPDELLSAIFLAVPNAVGHAFALAGTCRWWRAVALSLPHLWARVNCVLEDTADAAAQGRWAGYLRTHLARAGSILLDARLEYSCDGYFSGDLRAAVLAVWQRSERFELVTSLEFDRLTEDDPFDFLRAHAPHLVDLRVDQTMQLDSDDRAALELALRAPKLKKFAFGGAMLVFDPDFDGAAAVMEAEVLVDFLDGDALPDLFACFPHLEKLHLFMSCDLLANSVVHSDRLLAMRLQLPSGTINQTTADTLRFPSLLAAYVHIMESHTLKPDVIRSFMSNALGNVLMLHLHFDLVPGFAEGIAVCTRLRHLVLRSILIPITDADEPVALVEALGSADRLTGSWPCPQLETITIHGKMTESVFAQKLVALAEARRALTVPISRIEVEGFDALQNRLNEILGSGAE